ncbi:hypothetical protein STEG23_013050 [Scotinomys teguina]
MHAYKETLFGLLQRTEQNIDFIIVTVLLQNSVQLPTLEPLPDPGTTGHYHKDESITKYSRFPEYADHQTAHTASSYEKRDVIIESDGQMKCQQNILNSGKNDRPPWTTVATYKKRFPELHVNDAEENSVDERFHSLKITDTWEQDKGYVSERHQSRPPNPTIIANAIGYLPQLDSLRATGHWHLDRALTHNSYSENLGDEHRIKTEGWVWKPNKKKRVGVDKVPVGGPPRKLKLHRHTEFQWNPSQKKQELQNLQRNFLGFLNASRNKSQSSRKA